MIDMAEGWDYGDTTIPDYSTPDYSTPDYSYEETPPPPPPSGGGGGFGPYTTKDLQAANWNEIDGGCPMAGLVKAINTSGHCSSGREIYRTGGGCGSGSTRCVTTNDPPTADRCPSNGLGGVSSVRWTGTQYYTGGLNKGVGIVCDHTSLPPDSVLFSDSAISAFFIDDVRNQMRTDRCNQYNFSSLKNDTTTCKLHYDRLGGIYNKELFKRIVREGPTWITDDTKRNFVMTCITSGDSSLAQDAANLFFERINGQNPSGRSYQGETVTNPSDIKDSWGQNNTAVIGFINQLLRTSSEAAGAVVPPSIQTIAIATARSYCSAHPDHSACACLNVTKDGTGQGANALLRCSTTDAQLPGCDELKDLNNKFAGITSPNLAPFVSAAKSAFIPRCFSSKCKAADAGGSQDTLRPDVYQPAACAGDIVMCISSISAGRDIKADVNVQQSCRAATGQALPADLSSVSDQSGETVTVGGGGSPSASSGPTRQGCVNGSCTQGGETFQASDLIIKPGTSEFVDKYLNTPKKQKGAIGGCILCLLCCCCILFILLASS